MVDRQTYIRSKLKKTREPLKRVDLLNQLAWEIRYNIQEESKKCSEEALKISKEKDYPRGRAYARINLGVNHFLKSENKEALELLRRALKYFTRFENEKGLSVALAFTGYVFESFGDYETGLEYAQKSLDKVKMIRFREGEAEIQSLIGLIYSRLPDYDRALIAYNEGLKIREKIRDRNAAASSFNRIGRIYSLKKEYDKALENYRKSLRIRKELNLCSALPWTYLGIASTYEEMNDLENAKKYYHKNLEEGIAAIDKRCSLQSMAGMGRVLLKMKHAEEAHKLLDDSMVLAKELKAKPLIYEIHFALADYYESSGDPAKALKHYKIYHELREEVNNDEARNRLKNQQIAFAVEKTEKEKEIFQLRNVELKAAYDEIQLINLEITTSINYASRIQAALLPQKETLEKTLSDHFILFLPRDVVSGDFYWASQVDNKIVFCAADCTGHGVPGAFMSMLGITFLDGIIHKQKILRADEILNRLKQDVMGALKQTGRKEEQKEGIDIALCIYDPANKQLEFAGAYLPLYLIRKGKLEEYTGNKIPISYVEEIPQSYQSKFIEIKKGDVLYLFSDGYADQFGGPDGKKFKYVGLKQYLTDIYNRPMEEQKKLLEENFYTWKGSREQIDDVILMGVRF
jgi:serine phosphatase RsbU (regulator of sigma subunit)/predicted negative regulator of RcsB-dependent stress response